MRPVLIDTFCKAGGCTRGYQMAGFYVVGCDIEPQPRYVGDAFVLGDALEVLEQLLDGRNVIDSKGNGWQLGDFSAIHASPPCQKYSNTRNLHGNDHPDLIAAVRTLLQATSKPYVIENVQGAPLADDAILLVGSMFGLRTMRPRLFECSFPVPFLLAPPAAAKHAKMGRPPKEGEYVHAVGHMSDVPYCRKALGIDWMVQGELAQAIPPRYTEHIGRHLMQHLIGVPA